MKNTILGNGNVVLTENEKLDMIDQLTVKYEEIFDILKFNKEDPQLKGSPKRISKMYVNELLNGNYSDEPAMTVFPNTKKYDEMVYLGPINVMSMCSHHWAPFTGNAYIAYIPGDKVVGISKLARIVKWFMSRPQIQEELTKQIADYIEEVIHPLGIAVHIEATHLCMVMRGVKENSGARMKTSDLRGAFKDNIATRNEFYRMIK